MLTEQISLETVEQFIGEVVGQDLHAKRVLSLAGAMLGAMRTCSLAVAVIGQGLALARGLETRHAVKQVDRMLSNPNIDVDALLPHWVRYVVGERREITVAMDWTEFDADGQATLMLSLLCSHGRATRKRRLEAAGLAVPVRAGSGYFFQCQGRSWSMRLMG